ncbi:MAG: bifunctional diaminohydroxyphosphoribosylaminopyrimidine deaminase/5-amino-6-(5-phosphoribosylamino)uracil reductase RibD [Xanthomonadales bacterium]|nr:bifunctional diaminohydroxyphosphoribosylaminopyrimidine deaminase/5-amino-6-(5-phosphoribosylamino)uracil reductase RibD [Xanthomonadales bacterium]NIN59759.1 bifunctional diaminohydroxyphosphoribosylaminopyrimidine deaminase/5-amino-6-(5-phosphoribosylamino)uracil reductase RibD [Xanthomonadales bacterium]NIN75528.1 bifunctional diaminohydroxyphosphoribosylaminopyrimidine deaminase/5-amino-6-(5-phosphoribosylamino)uracil reductase RibD [Xanthomonadales bacterium]NIO15217.1 bifunctional diam
MSWDAFDHRCMAEALRLARRGLDGTHPNPRVGCVIARDGRVLGRGWHAFAGGPHAEIGALEEAGEGARGATAYVSLEPCSHHGRTAPCTAALIEAGIARVVSAVRDPNPSVDGDGERQLRDAGVAVESGLMAAAAEALNAGFFKRMRGQGPWVRVKLAQSLDGRTALASGQSQWITGEAARRDVQAWRARASAVLTGIGTVRADDPALNVRTPGCRRQPLRVIADSRWQTPPAAHTLSLEGEVLIAGRADLEAPAALAAGPAELLPLPARGAHLDLRALMQALAAREVNEVQVEAGATLCGALLEERLVDEILLYQAPLLLGAGARDAFRFGPLASMEERVPLQWLEQVRVGRDLRLRLRPDYGDR